MQDIAAELRWILLAFGLLLIVVLAVAGRRRRQAMTEQSMPRVNAQPQRASYEARESRDARQVIETAPRIHDAPQHYLDDDIADDIDDDFSIQPSTSKLTSLAPSLPTPLATRAATPVTVSAMVDDTDHSSSYAADMPSFTAYDDGAEPRIIPLVDNVMEAHRANVVGTTTAEMNDAADVSGEAEFIETIVLATEQSDDEHDDLSLDLDTTASYEVISTDLEVTTSSAAPSIDEAQTINLDAEQRRTGSPTARKPIGRKIISLRLMVDDGRISGAKLRRCFDAEQLTHGKYDIFHRLDDDGLALFSVASMVEPGTFNLATMNDIQFPGVTFFMQLPCPQDATSTYDLMLGCARNVEDALNATLQDERGVALSPLRAERLREEIIDFQHLMGTAMQSDSRNSLGRQ